MYELVLHFFECMVVRAFHQIMMLKIYGVRIVLKWYMGGTAGSVIIPIFPKVFHKYEVFNKCRVDIIIKNRRIIGSTQ